MRKAMMTGQGPIGKPATWIGRVHAKLARWRRSGLGLRWVVAVSGGSDSIGLLRVLHAMSPELGLELSVAHLDHGVRGAAAAADASFVAELATSLGLAIDLGHWQPERSGHFEADARRARYSWLTQVAETRGASAVAVGHTCDDQAQTILHRIVRGTGLRGLSGIPARRPLTASVQLVRPLLGITRQEVRSHLAVLGQPFRDDATNADLARTRSRIRHDLLPRLAVEYNPRVIEALVRLGRLAGSSQHVLKGQVEQLLRSAKVSISPQAVVLLCGPLLSVPLILRVEVIRTVWRQAGWPEGRMGASDWLRIAAMVRRDRGRFTIKGGINVWLSGDILRLAPRASEPEAAPPAQVDFPVPGSVVWGEGRITAASDAEESYDETIDLDRLTPFLTTDRKPRLWIKAPADGDRFQPLGMEGKSMALNDFFRSRHVSFDDRRHVPLMCDRGGIIWVVGHRIAHRVRQTDETKRTLGLRWEKTS
ncbi:MAG TPA: tRNA lysidine(34) synthetase TilS [Isosphaeraceae bacterium]|jgi:tRNA(Ile)-lysidine synthase|nr:tRNA lysidine(34) synthetase TilS [Isosphaeraceae bacterium]